MTMLDALRPQVFALPRSEQFQLVSEILAEAPPPLEDEDDGVAEANRRIGESHLDPSVVISMEELAAGVAALRRK